MRKAVEKDFNAQLHPFFPGLVGGCSTPTEQVGLQHEPSSDLSTHSLIAVNTWCSGRGSTFAQGSTRTQIDFLFTFQASSKGPAKKSSPAKDVGLGRWKRRTHPSSGSGQARPSLELSPTTSVDGLLLPSCARSGSSGEPSTGTSFTLRIMPIKLCWRDRQSFSEA